ncbi:MAG: hypothetical protein WAZ31_09280 [Rectinemataceae bacterium]
MAFTVFTFVAGMGAFAQAAVVTEGGIDVPAMVKDLGLPKDKAEAATTVINGFVGQIQESGKALVALLSQKKPEQILDAQVSAKIVQVQKNFALKFEKFKLDLADVAGEANTIAVAVKFKALIPVVLLPETATAPAAVPSAAPLSSTAASKKPAEIPLGSAPMASMPTSTTNGGSSLDLSVDVAPGAGSSGGMDAMEKGEAMGMDMMAMEDDAAMKGMDMMGMMEKMPMDSMMGMMAMEDDKMSNDPMQIMAGGSMPASGNPGATDPVVAQLLIQLQATNNLMSQILSSPASAGSASAQVQVQLLVQLSASQTALIRQILGAAKTSQPSGSMQSGSMSMM